MLSAVVALPTLFFRVLAASLSRTFCTVSATSLRVFLPGTITPTLTPTLVLLERSTSWRCSTLTFAPFRFVSPALMTLPTPSMLLPAIWMPPAALMSALPPMLSVAFWFLTWLVSS